MGFNGEALGLAIGLVIGLPVLIVALVANVGMTRINLSGLRHNRGRTKAIPLAILGLGAAFLLFLWLAIWMVPVLITLLDYSRKYSGYEVWGVILVIGEVVAVVASYASLVAGSRVLRAALRGEPPQEMTSPSTEPPESIQPTRH